MPEIERYELTSGNGPPLVGVHGAGSILFFGKLARHLGTNQSLFVLQGKGLDRGDRVPELHGIRDLAAAYARITTDLAAGQPVFVCGRWGPIVLETGRTLLEAGVDVAALIVFDAGPGGGLLRQWTAARRQSSHWEWAARAASGAPWLKGCRTRFFRWRYPRPSRGNSPPVDKKTKVAKNINRKLTLSYKPEKFGGRIVLVRSEEFQASAHKSSHQSLWRSLSNDFQLYVTGGTHHGMWNAPHVAQLGALVQRIIDDTLADRGDVGAAAGD